MASNLLGTVRFFSVPLLIGALLIGLLGGLLPAIRAERMPVSQTLGER